MFRACLLSQSSRSVASSSTSSIHTSAIRCEQMTNKVKKELKAAKWERINANRPSPILGTRPGEEWKWEKSDLAKILVKQDLLAAAPKMVPIERSIGTVQEPQQFAFAVTEAEANELFGNLPILSSQVEGHSATPTRETQGALAQHTITTGLKSGERELRKANMFAKVIDLRNADADGIAYENRRRIIEAFSGAENPFDPGRTEVQAAILTYRIRNLWDHLTKFKRDVGNRRGLRKLVHHRAKILKYLKRTDRERYDILLERLALEPESVEGELIV